MRSSLPMLDHVVTAEQLSSIWVAERQWGAKPTDDCKTWNVFSRDRPVSVSLVVTDAGRREVTHAFTLTPTTIPR